MSIGVSSFVYMVMEAWILDHGSRFMYASDDRGCLR